MLIGGKQAVAAHFQAGRGADDAVLCALADGDDHARAGEKLLLTGRGNVAVLVHLHFLIVDAVVGNAGRAHAVVKLYAVGLGVVHLAHASGRLVTAAEHADMAHALAQGGAGHVHGRIARANLLAAFKNGHIVTAAGQQYADGDACRAAADDGHARWSFFGSISGSRWSR